VNIYTYISY